MDKKDIHIISFTDRGEMLSLLLAGRLGGEAMRCGRPYGLQEWTQRAFHEARALVFVGAAGIAVRAIAPLLQSKDQDPAVVVTDETGRYVIPLLSGHLGGANDLARQISCLIGAEAVITTATDRNQRFAVDAWARWQDCAVSDVAMIREISSRVLGGETIRIYSEYPISGNIPEGVELIIREDAIREEIIREETTGEETADLITVKPAEEKSATEIRPTNEIRQKYDVLVSIRDDRKVSGHSMQLIPRCLSLGVGCKKGTDREALEEAFQKILRLANVREEAVFRVCSIDRKREEKGLLDFCASHSLELVTFSAGELETVEGTFSQSDFVKQMVGVDNVCERSALKGCEAAKTDLQQEDPGKTDLHEAERRKKRDGSLLIGKQAGNGMTMALAARPVYLNWKWHAKDRGWLPVPEQ